MHQVKHNVNDFCSDFCDDFSHDFSVAAARLLEETTVNLGDYSRSTKVVIIVSLIYMFY